MFLVCFYSWFTILLLAFVSLLLIRSIEKKPITARQCLHFDLWQNWSLFNWRWFSKKLQGIKMSIDLKRFAAAVTCISALQKINYRHQLSNESIFFQMSRKTQTNESGEQLFAFVPFHKKTVESRISLNELVNIELLLSYQPTVTHFLHFGLSLSCLGYGYCTCFDKLLWAC